MSWGGKKEKWKKMLFDITVHYHKVEKDTKDRITCLGGLATI